jgi:MFS family permease
MRFGILRIRTVSGANIAGFILNIVTLSMFLTLTLYMQQVLEFSAMQTGLAYLAVALSAILWSTVAGQLVTRVGVKPVLVAGLVALAVGLGYFTQISVGGSYAADLLPGFLLIGMGCGFSFVAISIAALAGVEASEAGLASGLINTSQQIGGALGVAAVSTIATSRTEDALASGSVRADALVTGFHGAFVASVMVAVIGLVATVALIRRDDFEQDAGPRERATGFEPATLSLGNP